MMPQKAYQKRFYLAGAFFRNCPYCRTVGRGHAGVGHRSVFCIMQLPSVSHSIVTGFSTGYVISIFLES